MNKNKSLLNSENIERGQRFIQFPSNKYNKYTHIRKMKSYFCKSNNKFKHDLTYTNQSKSKCIPKIKKENYNSFNKNNDNKNLFESHIKNDNYSNLEMKEDIQEIKNELNKNKSIINDFSRNLNEYRSFISQLLAKNKNLEDNSQKLIIFLL